MGKTKTKKFRGGGRHGRGRKAGRGKGLRGGKGNAGLHKHKFATTVKWQLEGYFHFGRIGMKPVEVQGVADEVLNVGDLPVKFPGQASIDLGKAGFTKLLGAGDIRSPLQVTVEAASASAIKKIEAAGGKVQTSRKKKEPKPKAPAKGAPAPAAPKPAAPKAEKPAKPQGQAPASKPQGDQKPAGGAPAKK
jgi:large subunit ribosomal protein L15